MALRGARRYAMQKLNGPGTTPSTEQPPQTSESRPKVDVLKAARLGVAAQARLGQRLTTTPTPGTAPVVVSDVTAASTVLRKGSSQALTRTARRRTAASSRAAEAARAARQGQAYTGSQRQRLRPETREQMLERLTNPIISLHEASVLLRVCPATVRRYTKSGLLPYSRTEGQQRRFYFKDVLALMRQLESRPR